MITFCISTYNNLPYLINIDNYKEKHNKFIKRKLILEKIRLCH